MLVEEKFDESYGEEYVWRCWGEGAAGVVQPREGFWNLISVPLQVVNKVEESKEKCYEISHYLVSILHIEKFLMDISSHVSQVEVIWEAHIDWWKALITWLRSLGGLKGICDILQCLHDFTNSLIHLLHCSPSSRTFLANQLALLNEQDVAKPTNWASSPRLSWWSSWSSSTLPSSFPSPPTASLALAQRWRRLFQWQGCWPSPPRLRSDCYQQNWR